MEGNKKPEAVAFSRPAPKKRFEALQPLLAGVKKHYSKLPKPAKLFVKLLPLLVLILITFGVYRNANKFASTDLCRGESSSPIYKEAANVINPQASSKLGDVVRRIKQMKRYDRDPNCMYAVTVYYINISDAKNAKESLTKLKSVYDSKTGFSKDYRNGTIPISFLETKVKGLDILSSQADKGTINVKP